MAKVNPKLDKNNKVLTMGDFFCGSGGFITEYIRFLNDKYENKINWIDNIFSLYGCDTDRDIVKSAIVDILLLTDTFSDLLNKAIINKKNIKIKDYIKKIGSTFDDEFYDDKELKVMYNFTNPPYGGSGKGDDDKIKISNGTKAIKHIAITGTINKPILKDTQKYIIKGDNKETLSLLHGMGVLDKNGIYCGVLKEGVFFDKKFKDLRKNLIENYEVKYVISVPQSDFWNTSTKTSILIFKNSGKTTSQINFCELKETNKENVIQEINPETNKIISEFITDEYKFTEKGEGYLSVDIETLRENGYSLNFKNYIKQDIKVNEGFKVVKLGDICDIIDGYAFKSEDFKEKGVALVQISNINNYLINNLDNDKCVDYDEKYKKFILKKGDIILGMTGNIQEKIAIYSEDKIKYLNQRVCKLTNFENEYVKIYVYYYWVYTKLGEYIQFKANGSIQQNISKENLKNLEIPIPTDISTIKLYLDYLNPANESLQSLQSLQSQKERTICGLIKMLTSFGKNGVEWDEYRLGDIITLKAGKFNTKNMSNTGEYPFYNASINNPIGTHNEYCFDGEKYILFIKSGNVNANSVGNVLLVKGKIGAVPDTLKITTNYNYDYIYYYLKSNYNLVKSFAETSVGLGHISTEKFKNMKIRIPKPEILKKYKLEEEFEFMDKLKNDISQTLKNQEDITKQMMKLVLSSEKKETEENEEADEEMEETEETEEDIEELDELDKLEKELEEEKPKRKINNVKVC